MPPLATLTNVIDGQTSVLMPGLVNTHCHVPMVLMRGYGGGHDLNTWLNQYIFPVEDKLTTQSIRGRYGVGCGRDDRKRHHLLCGYVLFL